jgi:dipeptidyl aminopeptidase/acylaminoacyl peptidase
MRLVPYLLPFVLACQPNTPAKVTTPTAAPTAPDAVEVAPAAPSAPAAAAPAAPPAAAPKASPRDPAIPAAITVEGVPAVPKSLDERLLQYQNVRGASLQGLTRNGALILTRFADTNQIHLVASPGARREQLTFLKEPVARAISLPKSGEILFTQSVGGDENFQLYRLDQKSGKAVLLSDGKSRHEIGALSQDGALLAYAKNSRNGKDMDLFLLDTSTGASESLFEVKDEAWSVADFSSDKKTLLLRRYVSANEDHLYLYERDTKTFSEILDVAAGSRASHGAASFAPSGAGVYFATNASGEFRQLAYATLREIKDSASAKKPLTLNLISKTIAWDVSELAVGHTGAATGKLAFSTNEDGASKLYLLDDKSKAFSVVSTPLGVLGGLDFSVDGNALGFTLSRPDAPGDVYSYDLKGKKTARWTTSEVGGLDASAFVTPSLVRYKTFDGREIPAYVYKPKKIAGKSPVVIQIHGGPEGQFQPNFSGLIQFYVNELGLTIIAPNVRGSTGYGKTYLALDDVEKREDSVKDIGALLDWIGTQADLDSKRVAVVGGSYGGYMVLASLVMFGDKIKAGIDTVGIANFTTFLEKTSPYRVDLRRVEYGDERKPDIRAFFERISPANHADKIKSALMVVHGKNDPRVPFAEAEQIAAKVRKTGGTVWTVYADNEGHGFGRKENRDYLNAATVLFFQEYLFDKSPRTSAAPSSEPPADNTAHAGKSAIRDPFVPSDVEIKPSEGVTPAVMSDPFVSKPSAELSAPGNRELKPVVKPAPAKAPAKP